MKIDITGSRKNPASESADASRQNGAQTWDQASDTVLITQAEVAFRTAAAAGVRPKQRGWLGTAKNSRAARTPFQARGAYLERARMAREMERL